ncbi:unnamed protein product [Cuscuta campestris]|uniref:Uncharacterized protein n=1 Tax=Cuscuta campestris TaxID=132261 RepID=A0A484NBU6_9ASTE|nr:unnamed protein product [Cuscuta campestris]
MQSISWQGTYSAVCEGPIRILAGQNSEWPSFCSHGGLGFSLPCVSNALKFEPHETSFPWEGITKSD